MQIKIVIIGDIGVNECYVVCVGDTIINAYCTLSAAETAVKNIIKSKKLSKIIDKINHNQEKVVKEEAICE